MKKMTRKVGTKAKLARPSTAKSTGIVGNVMACIGYIGRYFAAKPKKLAKTRNN